MPLYKDEKRKTWFYTFNYKDEYGNKKQKKKRGFKTKKEAAAALRKLEVEYQEGTYLEPSNIPLEEYMIDWLSFKKNSVSEQTCRMYKDNIKNHIGPSIGHIKLSQIKPLHIQNFITTLYEKELASTTIKRVFSVVNTALNYAVKVGDLKVNPASKIDKPRIEYKEMKYWNVEETNLFLKQAKGERLLSVFLIAILTGLRQGEILGLRWQDIDFQNRTISVKQILDHSGKGFKPGAKTKSSVRKISISWKTVEILESQKERISRDKEFYEPSYNDYDLVFCTETGTPVNPRNLLRVFYRVIENANLPKIRFHDLRHTHATFMIAQNEPVKLIADRLGHSKITTTMDTYGHLLPNAQHQAADKLDKTIFG